jgi:hypothetical protein
MTRDEMANHLLAELESWDHDELMDWAWGNYAEWLDSASDHELEEAYEGRFGICRVITE